MLECFKKIYFIGTAIAFFAFLPLISSAQFNFGGISSFADELGVEVIPEYPRPNQKVFINLSLYTGDLNSADISWYENSKLVLDGKGETRYSFTTSDAGTKTTIEVRVRLIGGGVFSKSFSIIPASVNLIWEASSYVPPFYKGKALHARQGKLKVVAMPNFIKDGVRILPQNLIYEWSNGNEAYQSQSGYGKNVLVLSGSVLGRDENVELFVRDPVNNLVASAFITVRPRDPKIVFYENNPYYGYIFDSALKKSFSLKNGEVQIVAAPFYFSSENWPSLEYDWRLNNNQIFELSRSRTAIFRKPEEGSGKSAISLNIGNPNKILQQANEGVVIEFNN